MKRDKQESAPDVESEQAPQPEPEQAPEEQPTEEQPEEQPTEEADAGEQQQPQVGRRPEFVEEGAPDDDRGTD